MSAINNDIYIYNLAWSENDVWIFNTISRTWKQERFPFSDRVLGSCVRDDRIIFGTHTFGAPIQQIALHAYNTMTQAWEPTVYAPPDDNVGLTWLICRPQAYQVLSARYWTSRWMDGLPSVYHGYKDQVKLDDLFTVLTLHPNNTWESHSITATKNIDVEWGTSFDISGGGTSEVYLVFDEDSEVYRHSTRIYRLDLDTFEQDLVGLIRTWTSGPMTAVHQDFLYLFGGSAIEHHEKRAILWRIVSKALSIPDERSKEYIMDVEGRYNHKYRLKTTSSNHKFLLQN